MPSFSRRRKERAQVRVEPLEDRWLPSASPTLLSGGPLIGPAKIVHNPPPQLVTPVNQVAAPAVAAPDANASAADATTTADNYGGGVAVGAVVDATANDNGNAFTTIADAGTITAVQVQVEGHQLVGNTISTPPAAASAGYAAALTSVSPYLARELIQGQVTLAAVAQASPALLAGPNAGLPPAQVLQTQGTIELPPPHAGQQPPSELLALWYLDGPATSSVLEGAGDSLVLQAAGDPAAAAAEVADLPAVSPAFDAAAMEAGLRRFLDQLDGWGEQLTGPAEGMAVPPWLMAVALAAATGEAARRQLKRPAGPTLTSQGGDTLSWLLSLGGS